MRRPHLFLNLSRLSATLGLSLLIWACSDDKNSDDSMTTKSMPLPAAFAGAKKVDVTMGAKYEANPATSLAVTVVDGKLRLLFTGLLPCEWYKQEAYVQKTEGGYEVLIQDMITELHNACGSDFYNMRLYAGPGAVGDTVTVFVRGPGSDEATPAATATAEATPTDCDNLVPCGTDTPCEKEGFQMDERTDDYTMGCTTSSTCGGSFCLWDAEACMMECRALTCPMGESYPLSPLCGG